MWATLKCFVRRFTGDAHLEALLRHNREALERKRREARVSAPPDNVVMEKLKQSA